MPLPSGSFMTGVLAIAHFALAAGVTLHVLLTKRNPASSVAWIGLAWLSPVIGSVLYALLGINRVRRRARTLSAAPDKPLRQTPPTGGDRDDHLAPLEFAGRRITQRCVEEGTSVEVLVNGDAAYPLMLQAIDAAKRSVALSSYIFRTDSAGEPFIEALIRAHQRGAEVRVLIDGYGGGYFQIGRAHV